jgi:hypothetical protein
LVLHLHRLLFSFTEGRGGCFKTDDNLVVDRRPDGTRVVRFEPVSARETPFFTEELVARTRAALQDTDIHPLVVIAAFTSTCSASIPSATATGAWRASLLATSCNAAVTEWGAT